MNPQQINHNDQDHPISPAPQAPAPTTETPVSTIPPSQVSASSPVTSAIDTAVQPDALADNVDHAALSKVHWIAIIGIILSAIQIVIAIVLFRYGLWDIGAIVWPVILAAAAASLLTHKKVFYIIFLIIAGLTVLSGLILIPYQVLVALINVPGIAYNPSGVMLRTVFDIISIATTVYCIIAFIVLLKRPLRRVFMASSL